MLIDTNHGAPSSKHLQAYPSDVKYRFNGIENELAVLQRVLGIASQVCGPQYNQLYAAARRNRRLGSSVPAGEPPISIYVRCVTDRIPLGERATASDSPRRRSKPRIV